MQKLLFILALVASVLAANAQGLAWTTCGGAVISSFALVYPIAEREFYDPIVEDIEDSFRPGAVACDRHAASF